MPARQRVSISSNRELLARFRRDESGHYLVIGALVMPMLVGLVGLATDIGLWSYTHQTMQGAADSSAVTAATAYAANNDDNLANEANAVASSYGFRNGSGGTTVTVNRPPVSGAHTSMQNAVEVIITQPENRYFSAIISSQPVVVSARAVAAGNGGQACVLALNGSASGAISAQGSTNAVLNGCSLFANSYNGTALTDGGNATISALSVGVVGGISGTSNIKTTQGVTTGDSPLADPYAGVSYPPYSGCDQSNFSATTTATLQPGVYCGGMALNAGANITLSPGVYYLDQGSLSVNGRATLTGTGVTLVFTSSSGSNYATAAVNGGGTVNLTAPTSGPTAGIVIFGDRNMPTGTSFEFGGGSSQALTGAIYVPKGAVTFAGGTSSGNGCTQLVADTITFTGSSNFALNCNGLTKPIGSQTAKLVE